MCFTRSVKFAAWPPQLAQMKAAAKGTNLQQRLPSLPFRSTRLSGLGVIERETQWARQRRELDAYMQALIAIARNKVRFLLVAVACTFPVFRPSAAIIC